MSKDRELSVIDEILSALNKLDKTEDKQRAVEYVLRRVASDYYAGQSISSNQFEQMAKQQAGVGLAGPGQNKVFRGLA